MVVIAVLVIASVCAFEYTMSLAKDVQRSNTVRAEMDVGDGALEYAFGYWREICREKTNLSRPGKDFANLPLPTAALFGNNIPNFTAQVAPNADPNHPATIANFQIQAIDPEYNVIDQTITPPSGVGMAIKTETIYYLASADVSLTARGAPITTKLRRVFEKQLTSPWMYAIFFIDDLEIQPSPPMNVTGAVQTNANIYTAMSTLNFSSQMSYGNDWYIGFHPLDTTHNGTTPASPTWPSNRPPTREQGIQPYGLNSTQIFSTSDTNPNNDSYRELLLQANSNYPDPFTNLQDPNNPIHARYYDQADVRILIGAGNVVSILNQANTLLSSKSIGTDALIFATYTSAVSTGTTIQDNRENAQVTLTTLDVSKLYAAYKNGGVLAGSNFQGVVYISDTTAASAPANQRRAILVKNGSSLPTGGLTIVSDNGVYIQGDFNTGGTGTNVPSNKTGTANNPLVPTVSGYTRQPAAIAADAVMVLSNSWVNSNSSASVTSRVASNTTINAAFISGNVPSGAQTGSYSGGAENFPRFHEDWSNAQFTYYGSMVELYQSKYYTGIWGKSNVYNPPTRKWYFDTNFYKTPPPGSLILVMYNKGRWFTN